MSHKTQHLALDYIIKAKDIFPVKNYYRVVYAKCTWKSCRWRNMLIKQRIEYFSSLKD